MTYVIPLVHITHDTKNSFLFPYTSSLKWRKLPVAITIDGSEVTRYQAPFIEEYIDVTSGEIIKAANLRNDPRVPPQIHVGEIMLQRQALLKSLRREVREFAFFILQFRNDRRGITPGIDTLVEWYARIYNKRPSNIRRYITVLEKVGFLAGTSLLSPLFQRTGKTKTTKDHLGEDAEASVKLLSLSTKGKRKLTSKFQCGLN
jgi:hypothetical protein